MIVSGMGITILAHDLILPLFFFFFRPADEIQVMVVDDPVSRGGSILLSQILLDGQVKRLRNLDFPTTGFNVDPTDGSVTGRLVHSGADGASITCRGRALVFRLEPRTWSGHLRISRNGKLAREIPIGPNEAGERIVDDPQVVPQPWLLGLFGIGFAAATLALYRYGTPIGWLLSFAGAFHLLIWAGRCIGTNGDSPGYVDSIPAALAGFPAYFPRGYPLFLTLMHIPFGRGTLGAMTTLVQHGMTVVVVYWVYRLARRLLREPFALAAGLLVCVCEPLITCANSILSESATVFSMVGGLYYTLRYRENRVDRDGTVAGLLFSGAVLLRVIPGIAGLGGAACLLWRKRERGWMRGLAILFTMTAALPTMTVLGSWQTFVDARFSDGGGRHLYNRVILEQQLIDDKGLYTRVLSERVPNFRQLPHWSLEPLLEPVFGRKWQDLIAGVVLEGLRAHWFEYLMYTPKIAWRMFVTPSGWLPSFGDTDKVHSYLENRPLLPILGASIEWTDRMRDYNVRYVWPACWVLSLVGFAWAAFRRNALGLSLAAVTAAHLIGCAMVEYFNARFNVVVVPFVILLAFCSINWLFPLSSDSVGRVE